MWNAAQGANSSSGRTDEHSVQDLRVEAASRRTPALRSRRRDSWRRRSRAHRRAPWRVASTTTPASAAGRVLEHGLIPPRSMLASVSGVLLVPACSAGRLDQTNGSAAPDCRVTVLGFGGTALGNMYTAMSERAAIATLDAAYAAGIRYFDTAPLYGHGLSELRTGGGLRRFDDAGHALYQSRLAAEAGVRPARPTPACSSASLLSRASTTTAMTA